MNLTFLILLGGLLGSVATYSLQKAGLSAVIASCIVGLVGALAGHLLKNDHLALIIFAGSFVGMTSTAWGTWPMMVIGGLLAGGVYLLSLELFAGFGGRLGTIAFLSTILSWGLCAVLTRII